LDRQRGATGRVRARDIGSAANHIRTSDSSKSTRDLGIGLGELAKGCAALLLFDARVVTHHAPSVYLVPLTFKHQHPPKEFD
jgi:hypothetical protein